MSTSEEAYQALTQNGFKVEDKRPERDYLVVMCNTCKARWSLGIKDGKVHGGNILSLLDHAGGHLTNKGGTP